ncbi:hypothetical protein AAG906_016420 [Vitis piasezkii]
MHLKKEDDLRQSALLPSPYKVKAMSLLILHLMVILEKETLCTIFMVTKGPKTPLLSTMQNKIYMKNEKCSFAKEEVSFLGYHIKNGKLMMDDSKGYLVKAAPLTNLLKKIRHEIGMTSANKLLRI